MPYCAEFHTLENCFVLVNHFMKVNPRLLDEIMKILEST